MGPGPPVPIGSEAAADVANMRARMQKLAGLGTTFEANARRREARAVAAEQGGDLVTARGSCFMTARYWASAQWLILRYDEKNVRLNAKKRECYGHYASRRSTNSARL